MTAPDRDDLERVLGEMENIGCHWPQVSKLIAVARAAADVIDTVPATYDETHPTVVNHAAAMVDLGRVLSAITATNQQPCPGKFTAYLGEMQDAPCSLCGVKYINHPTATNQPTGSDR